MKNSKMDAARAYHEAGHAVAAWCLEIDIDCVTILPDGELAGQVKVKPEDPSTYAAIERGERWEPARFRAEKMVMCLQAGEVAQLRYNPRSVRPRQCERDRQCCIGLLRNYAPDEKKTDVRPHYNLLVKWTVRLIDQHWHLVEAVAKALLDRRYLSDAQILDVICSADEKLTRIKVQPLLDAVQIIRRRREGLESGEDAQ